MASESDRYKVGDRFPHVRDNETYTMEVTEVAEDGAYTVRIAGGPYPTCPILVTGELQVEVDRLRSLVYGPCTHSSLHDDCVGCWRRRASWAEREIERLRASR